MHNEFKQSTTNTGDNKLAQQTQMKQWIWGTDSQLMTWGMLELGHVSCTSDAHQVALENPRVACDVH